MLEAIAALLLLLLLVDVKGWKEAVDVIVGELKKGTAVLARGLYVFTRKRRPLSSAGSSGAVIAIARTRRARRNIAVFVRIICCKA
jgi:hypothetical protein